jgi:hypothetical protein
MKSCVALFSMDENSFPMSYPDDACMHASQRKGKEVMLHEH